MTEIKYNHLETVHNTKAAEIIIPYIMDIINPTSVLDVGCGIGTWLQVFSKHGVNDIFGIDGDYVDRQLLNKYISSKEFRAVDLEEPFDLHRKFDLAISLEVAEHLTETSADAFVHSICNHSDTIIFSAAIPGQIGQNHINEKWPSYWVEKFLRNGYQAYDPIRPKFWNDNNIEPWYRQNILLFSKIDLNIPKPLMLDIVISDLWLYKNKRISSLEFQLERIKSGKVGFGFYLKGLINSMFKISK